LSQRLNLKNLNRVARPPKTGSNLETLNTKPLIFFIYAGAQDQIETTEGSPAVQRIFSKEQSAAVKDGLAEVSKVREK